MAAKDLCTAARVYSTLGGAIGQADLTLHANEQTLIGLLITSVSDAIEKYCRRSFYSRTIDELYDGGEDRLLLREYPVQSITWVRSNPQAVLEVQNTSGSVQRATVAVNSTGLTLVSVASGVVTTTTSGLTYSGNPTLTALATAVSGVSGWTARAVGEYSLWPSADLYVTPYLGDGTQSMGARHARSVWASLDMHIDELSDYTWDPRGLLHTCGYFHQAQGYWRVKYTAGYTTIPEALTEAAAQWVALLFYQSKRDPNLLNSVETNSYSFAPFSGDGQPPGKVRALLAPYRRLVV